MGMQNARANVPYARANVPYARANVVYARGIHVLTKCIQDART